MYNYIHKVLYYCVEYCEILEDVNMLKKLKIFALMLATILVITPLAATRQAFPTSDLSLTIIPN